MAQPIIEGHLAAFVLTGELDVLGLVTNGRMNIIADAITELQAEATGYNLSAKGSFEPPTYSALRQKLPADYTFTEIRASIIFMEREQLAGEIVK